MSNPKASAARESFVSDLCSLSLAELSAQIRSGTVSPVEATEACLDRIQAFDPTYNSFITLCAEAALDEARERNAELAAGRWRGPLHGVPIALKDLFNTRGVRTTAGSAVLRKFIPDRDATVVRLLREAGAVVLGKLNMHEYAFGVTNLNPHYGPTRNPVNPDHITGGSSGGSAAAVAGNLCFGALGSDTGGSIRCPAALCGIVGLKPTYGRVSRSGVIPLSWSLDHVGPMTRTVEDAALMLEAIAGHDPHDPTSAQAPVPPFAARSQGDIRGMRLAIPQEHFWRPAHSGVREAVLAGVERLREAGALIEEISIPCLEYAAIPQYFVICSEAAAYHRNQLADHFHDYGPDVRMRLLAGLCINSSDYLDAQRARRLVRNELLATLRDFDAILTPTVPIPAPRLDQDEVSVDGITAPLLFFMMRNTFPFNLTGLPAVSVPCGRADGLPVGLQIAGRPWEEATILRIAREVERTSSS
jgi:aspartyl-tRNA(Asn)/glutamyl-tRNA(Gln) amidotransferase subunit A